MLGSHSLKHVWANLRSPAADFDNSGQHCPSRADFDQIRSSSARFGPQIRPSVGRIWPSLVAARGNSPKHAFRRNVRACIEYVLNICPPVRLAESALASMFGVRVRYILCELREHLMSILCKFQGVGIEGGAVLPGDATLVCVRPCRQGSRAERCFFNIVRLGSGLASSALGRSH